MTTPTSVDQHAVCALLREWIDPFLDDTARKWVDEKAQAIKKGSEEWVFFTSFSAVPRYTGKAELNLDTKALESADALRPGWMAGHWSVDQATRALMALSVPAEDEANYFAS